MRVDDVASNMWQARQCGVNRYWRHLRTIPTSTVFLRILEPVLLLSTWWGLGFSVSKP